MLVIFENPFRLQFKSSCLDTLRDHGRYPGVKSKDNETYRSGFIYDVDVSEGAMMRDQKLLTGREGMQGRGGEKYMLLYIVI